MLIELAHITILVAGLVLAIPFGSYMAKVFSGEKNLLTPILRPVERRLYRLCGIDETQEMSLKKYIAALVGFEILGIIFVFLIMELQGFLPLNPQGVGPMRWDLALNTAVSYVTNTNWVAYVGERDLSYLAQLLGPIVQDIISPSVGLAAVVTLARCFSRRHSPTVGNYWVDLTRAMLYVWVPLTLLLVFPLISQGVIQNFNHYVVAHTLEGGEQVIPGGPVGTIEVFKMVALDGLAWSSTHCAHPFENPTPLSAWLEMGYILLVPASIVIMIGKLARNRKISVALFATMLLLFLLSMPLPFLGEFQGNPLLEKLGVEGGVNMEGKEMRFTLFEHVIWIVTAMAPANGSTIAQHDSLMPLTVLQIMFNLQIGAPIFGCIGTGSLVMLHYFIVSMFLAALMTGRTPEMGGKKLDLREIILASVSFLSTSFTSLVFAAIAISVPAGLAALGNSGPHGLTEMLYAFTSTSINNGSFMAGLKINTPLINLTTVIAMLTGRHCVLLIGLLIGGSIARKGQIAVSAASLPVASPLFIGTVVFVIIIMSALTFFPALALGPILEHLSLLAGGTF